MKKSRIYFFSLLGLLCQLSAAMAEDTKRIVGYEKVELKNTMEAIRFSGENPQFPEGFFPALRDKIGSLGEYRSLEIEVVGHSDSDRLSAASRAKWGSNLGLSKLRAANTVKEIQKRLNFPGATFSSEGVGASEPLFPNDTPQNKANNRRGEVNITFEKPIYEAVVVAPKEEPAAQVSAPQTASPQPTQADEARAALAQSAEDEDANTLEEALTAVDENYSLIKKGQFGVSYGYSFTYSSSDAITFNPDNQVAGVQRDSRFTHSSTLSGSYGLKNNLTLGVSFPLVSTTRSAGSVDNEVTDDGIGDLGLSLRYQPWPVRLGKPNVTFSGSMSLPTGTDPYKINSEDSVATGSGTFGLSLAANVSKAIDPVIAYGSVAIGYSLPRDGLNQPRPDGQFLRSVTPKPALSYNVGIGYALSYGVSLNMGFQHSIAAPTELTFSNDTSTNASESDPFEVIGGHSALFNMSAGFRTSPGTVLSVNLGVGLTRESPDFIVGFSLPFSVEGFKSYFTEDE